MNKLKLLSSKHRFCFMFPSCFKVKNLVISAVYLMFYYRLHRLYLMNVVLYFSGRSPRESLRESWVTPKMMWFPPTLWVTAGEFCVASIVFFSCFLPCDSVPFILYKVVLLQLCKLELFINILLFCLFYLDLHL